MKIFISSDMEGTTGVVDWAQCRAGGPDYPYYRGLLTAEVNAAIDGALDGGATEFLVNDSHSSMQNLLPDALRVPARYLSGRFKPMYMMEGLDPSFDAVFFVSYHGSMGAESVLSHTYFPGAFAEVRLNGEVVGESGINALVACGYGVPVVLVTGDQVTAAEARQVCPDIRSAVVKHSIGRHAADSMHPAQARALIREEARLATEGITGAAPPMISLPATLGMTFRSTDYAALATRISGVTSSGPLSATITDGDPVELFRTYITVVLLCRGFTE